VREAADDGDELLDGPSQISIAKELQTIDVSDVDPAKQALVFDAGFISQTLQSEQNSTDHKLR
jgi:hypothetical protein